MFGNERAIVHQIENTVGVLPSETVFKCHEKDASKFHLDKHKLSEPKIARKKNYAFFLGKH